MTNQELKEFFGTQLSFINEKIGTNHEHTLKLLENIQIQTTKTNGRVNALEIQTRNIERDEASHIANCPNVAKIDALYKENEEIRMIKKYPKMALIVLVLLIGSLFGSVAYGLLEMHQLIKDYKIEQHK